MIGYLFGFETSVTIFIDKNITNVLQGWPAVFVYHALHIHANNPQIDSKVYFTF